MSCILWRHHTLFFCFFLFICVYVCIWGYILSSLGKPICVRKSLHDYTLTCCDFVYRPRQIGECFIFAIVDVLWVSILAFVCIYVSTSVSTVKCINYVFHFLFFFCMKLYADGLFFWVVHKFDFVLRRFVNLQKFVTIGKMRSYV